MKHRLIILLILLIISSTFVVGLFMMSQSTNRNGFRRTVPPIVLRPELTTALSSSDMYFAGLSGERVFLGDLLSPGTVTELEGTQTYVHEVNYGEFPKPRTSQILIYHPYFFLADLARLRIYRGIMRDWHLREEVHSPGEFFTELTPVSSESLILRTYRNDDKVFTLSRENFFRQEHLSQTALLEKQVDGILCTDGMLTFDMTSRRVVYTYFSRNQFICADTSLNLIYRGNTIDTTTQAKIEIASLSDLTGYTMASPPNIVNRSAYTFGNVLYVNSALVADNEDRTTFSGIDVLDSYDLTDGHYLKSYYLERYQGEKLRYFLVSQNRILVLTDNVLRIFQLEEPSP